MKKLLILLLLFFNIFSSQQDEHLKNVKQEIEKHLPIPDVANIVMEYFKPKPLVFYNIKDRSPISVASVFACLYEKNNAKNAFEKYKNLNELYEELLRKSKFKGGHLYPSAFKEIFEFLDIDLFTKVVTVNPIHEFAAKVKKNINESKVKHCDFQILYESDLAELSLNDANVIYMNSNLFDNEYMNRLLENFAKLNDGLIVITHKELPKNFAEFGFELIKTFDNLKSTWANETPVFIYKLNKK